jgi:hypothetical protein
MAKEVLKQIKIPLKQVFSMSRYSTYHVKYRVLSVGGTVNSAWSQNFVLTGQNLSLNNVLNKITIAAGNSTSFIVSWNILETLNIENYDIYVNYFVGSAWTGFQYLSSTYNKSITIKKPIISSTFSTLPTKVKIALFAQSPTKLDNSVLRNTSYINTLSTAGISTFLTETSEYIF